jgi:hypothetical protein
MWYELKFYRRRLGGSSAGKREDSIVFERPTDEAAVAEAINRTKDFEADQFAVLTDEHDTVVWPVD